MLERKLLGSAMVPGGTELHLYSHGRDFYIMLDRHDLMSTRMRYSEEQLAELTLDRLECADPHILVGGYGMGFTLRAALARLGPKGRVTVAELMPEIIDWARGPMAEVAAGCLDDARVTVQVADVSHVIAKANRSFDAILLDVDNGPDGLVRAENDNIYANRGLAAAMRALRPGGVLAIWSAGPDDRFTRQLTRAGYDVEELEVRARPNGKGPRHTIWFARPR
ncbi:spermidine synthase [Croceicoccus naphthovorans]|uniref:Spermidine synthase n=1 Tax=Croceicoccus naphthovorans TaxID=1348774 RepID=A0A0G3XER0_9SPHN|nr:methyltransferase domain-containing protein [Croceicoccus naphthovorans]AKM08878.1 spermidine synthase [Croceicoccus naphthovorans]MBB3989363.1 spermidine synthase [Croceicoccus naphthovorans]